MQPISQLVSAIVLKTSLQGEADLRVDLLTRERGRLTGLARHARKSRIRFGPLLEPFNILMIRMKERKGLAFLEEATLKVPLTMLTQNLDRLTVAFYCVDCVRTAIPEGATEAAVFDLLESLLSRLNRGSDPLTCRLLFEYRLMALLGIRPLLNGCFQCGRLEDPTYFVFKEGALFCKSCLTSQGSYVRLSGAAVRMLQQIGGSTRGCVTTSGVAKPIEEEVAIDRSVLGELDQLLPKHLEYHLGRSPRARESLALV